jgi:serine phosphatase RsbU (regulator of sigma subunit)/anti-sigma regulatory factor (Ser/Thr protein kinase)
MPTSPDPEPGQERLTAVDLAARADDDAATYGLARRNPLARYGFAAFAALVSFSVMLVFVPVIDEPLYALLVGAVAVTVWWGGLLPGVLAVAIGWSLSYVVFVGDPEEIDTGTEEELLLWGAAALVGAGVVWVSIVMRRGRERAAVAVGEAVASVRTMTELQQLASALSAAVSPSDVAHALIERTPRLLGARGGALGLIDGEDLVIVDPQGVELQTHAPGFRLPLATRAPITAAAREGMPVRVRDRETFEAEYPDGAALTLYAKGAVAVPVRTATGDVVGSMSFLFEDPDDADEDADAIAGIAADLGGQALERARLYTRERESRRALDRIVQVAPRFYTDSAESAAMAICAEARTTFGADVTVLWRRQGDELELMCSDPALDVLVPGMRASLEDFPRLLDAVEGLEISWIPDVQQEALGTGLERTRKLGLHSSLRVPIAVGGSEAELLLIVSWTRVLSDPDPSTFLLLQRFADQAGFALEQVERRRAQAEAARRAEETRRLQEITAALSLASTATDVSDTCLEHALVAVGAEAGFVVLSRPEGVTVDVVSSTGYTDDEIGVWGRYPVDSGVPFAKAIATGEGVWALSSEEMAAFAVEETGVDVGWVAIPLRTAAGVRGALHLSFRTPRELTEGERRWLQTVVSQCAQALERSRLFDAEQVLRRRSERLQGMTAALSNSLTPGDVSAVVVDEIGGAVGADATALATAVEERGLVKVLASRGYSNDALESWLELPLDEPTPWNRVLRRRVSTFYETLEALRDEFPEVADAVAVTGHESFLLVPLVAGRRANGLVVMSWAEQHAFAPEERRFVEALAGQAAQALDRASTFETEQTIAETLQRSVLPVSLPRVEGVQMAARYLPGTTELDVGGDWFDAMSLPDGRLGLVVGDVVGKGVQAAATMAQLRNALRAYSLERMKPSSTIARLNRLAEQVVETTFATVVYVVLDPERRVCRFTSAGHPPPLVAYPDGRVELLEGGRGLPLGAGSDTQYSQAVVELPAGSVLILYTDGLVERRGRPIDDGFELLREAARTGPRDPEQLVEHILERLVGSDERGDDIALLAIRLLTVAPQPLHLRIPSDVDSLDLVRDAVRVWLQGTPLRRADAHDVVLATWEACANSIEHALDPDDAFVDVRAELTDGVVRMSVENTGRWTPPTDRADRGLGLELIQAAMTSVDIDSDDECTRVTFEKTLRTGAEV